MYTDFKTSIMELNKAQSVKFSDDNGTIRRFSDTDYIILPSAMSSQCVSNDFHRRCSTGSNVFEHIYLRKANGEIIDMGKKKRRVNSSLKKTQSRSTQTLSLEQLVQLEVQKAKCNKSLWECIWERVYHVDWCRVSRILHYLTENWSIIANESAKDDKKQESNWVSICRTIFRMFFYVAPKIFTPSITDTSTGSQENPPAILPQIMDRSISLSSNSRTTSICSISEMSDSVVSDVERSAFSEGYESPRKHYESVGYPRTKYHTKRRHSMGAQMYGSYPGNQPMSRPFTGSQKDLPKYSGRLQDPVQRSYSLSLESDNSSGDEEINLDIHMTTPYSEQWNPKHYKLEKIQLPTIIQSHPDDEMNVSPNKESDPKTPINFVTSNRNEVRRLHIPATNFTPSDDDEVTPEVKYADTLTDDIIFQNVDVNDNILMRPMKTYLVERPPKRKKISTD